MKSVWEDGDIPSTLSKEVLKQIKNMSEPIKILYIIKEMVPERYFKEKIVNQNRKTSGDTKVILSSYLKKGEQD